MNIHFFACFIAFIGFVKISTAQTKIIVHENTTQHDRSSAAKNKSVRQKNAGSTFFSVSESAIKFNLLSTLRGDYNFCFEKKITKDFSAEASLGIVYYDGIFDNSDFLNYRPINYVSMKRQYQIGPSVRLGARWYLDAEDEEISGPYVSVEGLYRRYNTTAYPYYNYYAITKETNTHKELRLLAGWQDGGDISLYDFSVGVGYRVQSRNYLGYDNIASNNNISLQHGSKGFPVFIINLKFGIFTSEF